MLELLRRVPSAEGARRLRPRRLLHQEGALSPGVLEPQLTGVQFSEISFYQIFIKFYQIFGIYSLFGFSQSSNASVHSRARTSLSRSRHIHRQLAFVTVILNAWSEAGSSPSLVQQSLSPGKELI